ncbi:INO80 complex subunit B [Coemansia sp. RSA 988]|nr:INO80 complex subunit B [Coemansia sp. RSA 988]
MPPKRKVTNEDSSEATSSDSEASEAGTPVMRRTRGRKVGGLGNSVVPSTQSSPALNTRRASRLSVNADADEGSPKRRTRLTRGSRRGSDAAATADTPRTAETNTPTTSTMRGSRGGRGGRGRGRAGSGRGRASRRGALTSNRGRRARARTEDIGLSSTSISGTDQDEDSTEDYAILDKSEDEGDEEEEEEEEEEVEDPSDASGTFDSPSADRDASEMESEPVSVATGSTGTKDEEEKAEDDAEEPSDDEDVESNADTPLPLKKRRKLDGRGSLRSADQLLESTESSAGEEALEVDDISEQSGLSDGEGGLGMATLTANLTRRQRAKLMHENDNELMELPVEAKRSKFSAEESALRKSEHARRRKFQSLQRAEQLKNDTINRLLNKQSSKGRNKVTEDSETRPASVEAEVAAPENIRYIQRRSPHEEHGKSSDTGNNTTPVHIECALLLPKDVAIRDLIPSATDKGFVPSYPEPMPLCSVDGCHQKKKYSIELQAACSLDHWRVLKGLAGVVSKLA